MSRNRPSRDDVRPCPTLPAPTSLPELTALFSDVQQHFVNVIVPLWQGPGWNADMALPYEALDAAHQPLPPQRYRAMACARQLYLFSSLIGVVDNAEVRAAALFRSLQRHFHDAEHGGWFYSIDAAGQTAGSAQGSLHPRLHPVCLRALLGQNPASRWWNRR